MISPARPEFSYLAESSRLVSIARLVVELDLHGILANVDRQPAPTCTLCIQHAASVRGYERQLAEALLPFQRIAQQAVKEAAALQAVHEPACSITHGPAAAHPTA